MNTAMLNVNSFAKMKQDRRKITMLTCYDAWSAKLLDQTRVDVLLVGDSAAMVMHGATTTVAADVQMMAAHVRAVAAGAKNKFIVADMPFLAARKGLKDALEATDVLMKAGAHAIKIEGIDGHDDVVQHIVQSGVPVMGHLGLTPQSVHQLGGHHVQARDLASQEHVMRQALRCQEVGCFALVLECMPATLAKALSEKLSIPTIGIGAGVHVDGQVLVLQDMLGVDASFKPKFLRHYLKGNELISKAVNHFCTDVVEGAFPTKEESY